jgi:hypothetical protein
VSELLRSVVPILVYGLALILAAVAGFAVFGLARWPTIFGRHLARELAALLAFLAAGSMFMTTLSALRRAGAPSSDEPYATGVTLDPIKAVLTAAFIGAVIFALLRRLPRKRRPGDGPPSGPDMTNFAP